VTQPVTVHRDIVVSQVEGYRPLAADAYVPAGGARVACVYLHGGGWRVGSRREGPGRPGAGSARLFLRAAERGLAVISADYRLSGEARFPAQLHDVSAACAWVVEQGPDLGIDVRRLCLWGVSAGGQLAALRGLDLDAAPAVDAVVLWYPVTDLLSLPDDVEGVGGTPDRGPGSRESRLLGATPDQAPDLAREASPALRARPGAPPFLLLHGDADDLVPARQSERLAAALRAAGGRAELELVPGQGHMFAGMAVEELAGHVDRSVDFLLSAAGRPAHE